MTALILLSFLGTFGTHTHTERYYQEQWCNDHGGVLEYVLDDKSRVDCLTETHAVEVEFAHKWKEAVGQALFYAIKTNRRPGIVVIIEDKYRNQKYINRLKTVSDKYGIEIYEVAPN